MSNDGNFVAHHICIYVCYIAFPFRNALSSKHVYGEAYVFVLALIPMWQTNLFDNYKNI
jgi:hypothetical protein